MLLPILKLFTYLLGAVITFLLASQLYLIPELRPKVHEDVGIVTSAVLPTRPIESPPIQHSSLVPRKEKIILFWTTFFGHKDFEFGLGSSPFSRCPVPECRTTNDRNMLNQSDALVLHVRNLYAGDQPIHRLPNQRWIFYLMESPTFTPDILKGLGGRFNWTMTYRTDSDVFSPFSVAEKSGSFEERFEAMTKNRGKKLYWRDLASRKSKKVAWFVSHCQTPGGREDYVTELQKHIQVDIYGECGPLRCPGGLSNSDGLSCYEMMEKDYKFYLAFENSVCRDYATEKFYNALLYNTVPIVYGGADYAKLAPRQSYIDVRNFTSARALADYLNFLDENDEEYLKYFEWRKSPPGTAALPRYFQPWCNLCRMLHDPSLPDKSYTDIHSWWFDQGTCDNDKAKRSAR